MVKIHFYYSEKAKRKVDSYAFYIPVLFFCYVLDCFYNSWQRWCFSTNQWLLPQWSVCVNVDTTENSVFIFNVLINCMEKSVKHSKVEMMHVIFYPLYVFMLCLKIWILCFSKIWHAQKLKSLEPGLCLILHYKFLIFFFFQIVSFSWFGTRLFCVHLLSVCFASSAK